MMHNNMDTSTANMPMGMGMGTTAMGYQQTGMGGLAGMSGGMMPEQMRPSGLTTSESPRSTTSGRGRGRKNPGGPPAQR